MDKDRTGPAATADTLEHCKYWAFVSYSHHDKSWGEWLQVALESYRVPRRLVGVTSQTGEIPRRLYPVFRDVTELAVAGDLTRELQDALRSSRYLIVICSPNAVGSTYVDQEIEYFRSLGRTGNIFCLIVAGEPQAEKSGMSRELECFPDSLRQLPAEQEVSDSVSPDFLAADAREGSGNKQDARLRLIAGMLGIRFDDLKQREKRRRLLRLLFAGILILATIAMLAGTWTWQEIAKQREVAEKTIENLTSKGQRELEAGNGRQAAAFLAEAYKLGGDSVRLRLLLAEAMRYVDPQGVVAAEGLGNSRMLLVDQAGARVAAINVDGQLSLFEAPELAPLALGQGANARIQKIIFPTGTNTLISVGFDRKLRKWSSISGNLIEEYAEHDSALIDVGIDSRQTHMATIGADGSLMLWDHSAGKSVWRGQAGTAIRPPLAFDPQAQWLATRGSTGDALLLWDFDSAAPVAAARIDNDGDALVWTPDSSGILVSAGDGSLQLLTVPQLTIVDQLEISDKPLSFFQFNRDLETLVTLDKAGVIRVLDFRSRRPVLQFATAVADPIVSAFDGRYIALRQAVPGSQAFIWDTDSGSLVAKLGIVGETVKAVAMTAGSNRVYTAYESGRLDSWHLDQRAIAINLPGHRMMVNLVEFSTDGSRLVTAGSEGSFRVWDALTGQLIHVETDLGAAIYAAKYSKDDSLLVTLDSEGTVALWSPTNYQRIREFTGLRIKGLSLAASDPPMLALHSDDSVILWQPEQNRAAALGRRHDTISAMSFLAGDRLLAVAGAEGMVEIWDTELNTRQLTIWGHKDQVTAIDTSADGGMILTTSLDASAMLTDLHSGEILCEWQSPDGAMTTGRLSSNNQLAAAGTADGMLRVWDIKSCRPMYSLSGHKADISALTFAADDRLLISGSEDHSLRIWDMESGRLVRSIADSEGAIIALAVSPDGKLLATAAKDSNARIRHIDLENRSADKIASVLAARLNVSVIEGQLTTGRLGPGKTQQHPEPGWPDPNLAVELKTLTPESAVRAFFSALKAGQGEPMHALISADAPDSLLALQTMKPDQLRSLYSLLADPQMTNVMPRSDGLAAVVEMKTARGRVHFYLQRVAGVWLIRELHASPAQAAGWSDLGDFEQHSKPQGR